VLNLPSSNIIHWQRQSSTRKRILENVSIFHQVESNGFDLFHPQSVPDSLSSAFTRDLNVAGIARARFISLTQFTENVQLICLGWVTMPAPPKSSRDGKSESIIIGLKFALGKPKVTL
jgi:hypothetical protein